MTPMEALQLLDRAASHVPASRADHQTIAEAVSVLAALIPEDVGAGPDQA